MLHANVFLLLNSNSTRDIKMELVSARPEEQFALNMLAEDHQFFWPEGTSAAATLMFLLISAHLESHLTEVSHTVGKSSQTFHQDYDTPLYGSFHLGCSRLQQRVAQFLFHKLFKKINKSVSLLYHLTEKLHILVLLRNFLKSFKWNAFNY